jgi:hypothetical protein
LLGADWGQHVALLPLLEQTALWDQLRPQVEGASPLVETERVTLPEFLCPSDPGGALGEQPGEVNYRANAGSKIGVVTRVTVSTPKPAAQFREENDGLFVAGQAIRLRQVTRGMSQVVLFAEMLRGDHSPEQMSVPGDWLRIPGGSATSDGVFLACVNLTTTTVRGEMTGVFNQSSIAGRDWRSGHYASSRYNHVMPPNARSCVRPGSGGSLDGPDAKNDVSLAGTASTASSRHPGGVLAAFGDGSVRLIDENISVPVWREMGMRSGEAGVERGSRQ